MRTYFHKQADGILAHDVSAVCRHIDHVYPLAAGILDVDYVVSGRQYEYRPEFRALVDSGGADRRLVYHRDIRVSNPLCYQV